MNDSTKKNATDRKPISECVTLSNTLENFTFDEIEVGQTASLTKQLTRAELELFAHLSGNVDPMHLDETTAAAFMYQRIVGHGAWASSLISGVLGSRLPGPGSTYRNLNLAFDKPVMLGDTLTATVTVAEKRDDDKIVVFECECRNQNDDLILSGQALVVPPKVKGTVPVRELPGIQMIRHDQHDALVQKAQSVTPVPTSVVYPCNAVSLQAAMDGASQGLIEPVLIGPETLIRGVADANNIDITDVRIVDAESSVSAASVGVALARNGETGAVMKGSLHTDELMGAVVKRDTGLRTSSRISHVFLMNVPTYPKPLLITDAAVNIAPTLEEKVHIVQNAINLAIVLGVAKPKVAILSALETINPKIATTLEAATLCKMADRGQITGAILDGPLAFDNAISAEAAETKGLVSPVAGDADILLVPDLQSGNMLAKQLSFLANADAAGIVLGARVPIILTSRADNLRSRLASCALASLIAEDARAKVRPLMAAQ